MASWGRGADTSLDGTAEITANTVTVTGANTTFTDDLEIGNLVVLDEDNIFRVVEVTSDTEITVEPVATANVANAEILSSEAPKYIPVDEIGNITYVETSEINANTRIDGIKTPGWTLYEEYGSGRKRVEVLVAMKKTS
jgi:hypothetical protein